MHIHPVNYIAAMVRANRISLQVLDIHIRHQFVVVVGNNSRPMNYRQTNAIRQHGRLLQMPQSIGISAKCGNEKKKKYETPESNCVDRNRLPKSE